MPADGEFRFSLQAKEMAMDSYRLMKQSPCIRSSLVNGGLLSLFSSAIIYAHTYNLRKATKWSLPVFTATVLLTVGFCNREKGQKT